MIKILVLRSTLCIVLLFGYYLRHKYKIINYYTYLYTYTLFI